MISGFFAIWLNYHQVACVSAIQLIVAFGEIPKSTAQRRVVLAFGGEKPGTNTDGVV